MSRLTLASIGLAALTLAVAAAQSSPQANASLAMLSHPMDMQVQNAQSAGLASLGQRAREVVRVNIPFLDELIAEDNGALTHPETIAPPHLWTVAAYGYHGGHDLPATTGEMEVNGVGIFCDYRASDSLSLGGSLGWVESSSSALDLEGWSISPHLTYLSRDALAAADLVLTGSYHYTDADYGSADGETHAVQLAASLHWRNGGWLHGPYAQLRTLDGEIDATGGATTGESLSSTTSELGYRVSRTFALDADALVPSLGLGWEREYDSGNPLLEGDRFVAEIGLTYATASDLIFTTSYVGKYGDGMDSQTLSLVVSLSF